MFLGGGSALLTYPVPPLSLHDLVNTTKLLAKSGASITELNTVRKHLEVLKGGGLSELAHPATVSIWSCLTYINLNTFGRLYYNKPYSMNINVKLHETLTGSIIVSDSRAASYRLSDERRVLSRQPTPTPSVCSMLPVAVVSFHLQLNKMCNSFCNR